LCRFETNRDVFCSCGEVATPIADGTISLTPLELEAGSVVTAESKRGVSYSEWIAIRPERRRGGVAITVTDGEESHDFELTS